MKKMKRFVFAIFAAAALTGCQSTTVKQPVPAAESQQNIQNQPVPTQATVDFSLDSATEAKLRAKFAWNDKEDTFCRDLARRLAQSGMLNYVDIVSDKNKNCDIVITLNPEFEEKDKSGNYYNIVCNQIVASIQSSAKINSIITIEPKSMPRKLGLKNAKAQYLKPAVKELSPALIAALQKLNSDKLAVSNIKFQLKKNNDKPTNARGAAAVTQISDILKNMPGVLEYTNISQCGTLNTCTFRVVYLRANYPQGIYNALNLKLAKIK